MNTQISRTEAIYLIAGTAVGAGILALPGAMASSGFIPGLIVLIVMGIMSIFAGLYIVETSLKTGTGYHMPALAQYYLGKPGLIIMFLGILIFVYGALTGYLSAGGQLIHALSDGTVSKWSGTLIYFFASTIIVYIGLQLTGLVEILLISIMVALIFLIGGLSVPSMNPELALSSDWGNVTSIFGVTLFAYAAHVIIPTLAHGMKKDKRGLIWTTIMGFIITMAIYIIWCLVFTMAVPRGTPGEVVPPSETVTLFQAQQHGQPATIPLGHLIGGSVMVIGSIFAIMSTFTSYLGFGISMTDSWIDTAKSFNIRIARFIGVLLSVLIPLIMALANPAGFIEAINIGGIYGGSIFVGLLPPVLVLMARQKGPCYDDFQTPGGTWLPVVLCVFFILGMVIKTMQI